MHVVKQLRTKYFDEITGRIKFKRGVWGLALL
jgi:hypothetical protein